MKVWAVALVVATALAGCTAPEPVYDPGPVGRIDGAVLDHMLGPYADTKVYLIEEDRWTTTTELGGFSFLDVPPGIHTVEVNITGVGVDRELVIVEDQEISQVILQVWDLPPVQPYVSKLQFHAKAQIAEPGAACDSCRWVTSLNEQQPVAITYMAVWSPEMISDFETHLEITIQGDGELELATLDLRDEEVHPDGRRMMRAFIDGAILPEDAARVLVDVKFPASNELHHIDFEMESFLHIHYGMTDEAKALLS